MCVKRNVFSSQKGRKSAHGALFPITKIMNSKQPGCFEEHKKCLYGQEHVLFHDEWSLSGLRKIATIFSLSKQDFLSLTG